MRMSKWSDGIMIGRAFRSDPVSTQQVPGEFALSDRSSQRSEKFNRLDFAIFGFIRCRAVLTVGGQLNDHDIPRWVDIDKLIVDADRRKLPAWTFGHPPLIAGECECE